MNILSIVFITAGLFFLIVAAIGVVRLPMCLVVHMPYH